MLTSSRFFNPSEFLVTSTGLPNSLPADLEDNLAQLMLTMDRVREALGKPVRITSGYRSAAVNKAIGGAAKSDHLVALAADFVCANMDPRDICRTILDIRPHLQFDQLIAEFRGSTRWCHLGAGPRMRRQVLTYRDGQYLSGLV
jgi:putative chitinase